MGRLGCIVLWGRRELVGLPFFLFLFQPFFFFLGGEFYEEFFSLGKLSSFFCGSSVGVTCYWGLSWLESLDMDRTMGSEFWTGVMDIDMDMDIEICIDVNDYFYTWRSLLLFSLPHMFTLNGKK
jgi:hypothetical protein